MAADKAEVTLQRESDRAILVVRGQLDLDTVAPLRDALVEACRRGPADVVVDFEDVTFCGADTAGLLAGTAARLRASGCRLSVRGARPPQARVFRLCGLGHLLTNS